MAQKGHSDILQAKSCALGKFVIVQCSQKTFMIVCFQYSFNCILSVSVIDMDDEQNGQVNFTVDSQQFDIISTENKLGSLQVAGYSWFS